MRENRPSGLMRGGAQAVIGICLSTRRPRLLYTVMEPGSEILKVDEVGRVRTPPEKREAMLAEYDRSGMTGAQFARFFGVRYSTLMYWLQRRRKEAGQSEQMVTPRQDHPRLVGSASGGRSPEVWEHRGGNGRRGSHACGQ